MMMENPNGACSSLYILSSASPFTTASAAATASTTTTAAAVANPNPINDYCLIKKSVSHEFSSFFVCLFFL